MAKGMRVKLNYEVIHDPDTGAEIVRLTPPEVTEEFRGGKMLENKNRKASIPNGFRVASRRQGSDKFVRNEFDQP